jgi:hypothetical protein
LADRKARAKANPYRPEIERLLVNGSIRKFIARRYHPTEANLHKETRPEDRPAKLAHVEAVSTFLHMFPPIFFSIPPRPTNWADAFE